MLSNLKDLGQIVKANFQKDTFADIPKTKDLQLFILRFAPF
jgi:hypothetical protein